MHTNSIYSFSVGYVIIAYLNLYFLVTTVFESCSLCCSQSVILVTLPFSNVPNIRKVFILNYQEQNWQWYHFFKTVILEGVVVFSAGGPTAFSASRLAKWRTDLFYLVQPQFVADDLCLRYTPSVTTTHQNTFKIRIL